MVDTENGMGWGVLVGMIRVGWWWLLLVYRPASNTVVGVQWRRLRPARFGVMPLGPLKSVVVQAGIYRKLALLHLHVFRE